MGRAVARVHFHFGSLLAFWGWQAGACQAYRDALRLAPEFADAEFRLGEALARCGRWREASAAFARAARLRPSSPEAQGNLVLALGRAGRWGDTAEALRRLIQIRPGQPELHVLLGAVLKRVGDNAEAIRAFRWAVRQPAPPRTHRCFLGEALLGARDWADVVRSYEGALAARPGEARPSGLVAVRDSALNHYPACDRVAAARPGRPSGLAARVAAALHRLKRPAAPSRALRHSLLLPLLLLPVDAAPATGVDTLAAREQSRLCAALPREAGTEACRRALALGLGPRRAAIVRELLALKLAVTKRWNEVAPVYRELVELRPADAEAHLRLGSALLYAENQPEEALVPLRGAVALAPGDARGHGLLAVALNQLGRHAEAVAEFEEALRLDPACLDGRPAARETYAASKRGERWP